MSTHTSSLSPCWKVRYIYTYDQIPPSDVSCVVSFGMEAPDDGALALVRTERLAELVQKRRGDPAWRLYLYVHQGEIEGYSFLHLPTAIEWHDALPTRAGEARATSSFVEPAHRGRGVRRAIFAEQSCFCRARGLRLWSVIEKANADSIRATERSGGIRVATNLLIKVAGRNVISVLSKPRAIYLLVGRRRVRR